MIKKTVTVPAFFKFRSPVTRPLLAVSAVLIAAVAAITAVVKLG